MHDLISVIVAVFNVERFLCKCLETIINQTYKNLEIILIDDGSTDCSGGICDQFAKKDKRIVVIHQNNQGLWAARNVGMEVSHGDYLMFVDGDDYLHLGAISIMYEAITQNAGYDIVLIDRKKTTSANEDITTTGTIVESELSQKEIINYMFTYWDSALFVYMWNKLYRKEIIKDVRCREYPRSQDYDFNFRVYLGINKALWIHYPFYYYVQRSTSLVKTTDAWNLFFDCRSDICFRNYLSLSPDKKQFAPYLLKMLYRYMTLSRRNSWHTDKEAACCSKISIYKKATLKSYLLCRDIKFREKVSLLVFLQHPRLFRITNKFKHKKEYQALMRFIFYKNWHCAFTQSKH